MLSLHPTGEYFRASILQDCGNGTVDLQYSLSMLGAEYCKSKKQIMSLRRGNDVAAVWLKVSRIVGTDGLDELKSDICDFAGNLSHGALITWLESRGMGSLDEGPSLETPDGTNHYDSSIIDSANMTMRRTSLAPSGIGNVPSYRHIFLADLDPLHSGVVAAEHFKRRLERYRARKVAEGVEVFGSENPMRQNSTNYDTHEEKEVVNEKLNAAQHREVFKTVATSAFENRNDIEKDAFFSKEDEARLEHLEGLMVSMIQGERGRALALAEAEAKGAALNQKIESAFASKQAAPS